MGGIIAQRDGVGDDQRIEIGGVHPVNRRAGKDRVRAVGDDLFGAALLECRGRLA